MEILSSTLNHIAVLFSFILIGFILKTKNILPDTSGRTLSRLENGIFMPAVVINTFWNKCTAENISQKWIFLVYSTALLLTAIFLAFIISKFLTKDEYLRKVYRYSLSVSNFGFVGTALVQGIYGAESIELFDYLIFTLPLNMFTYSIGIAWLVPSDKGGFSLKSLLNPIFVSLFIGAFLGLFQIPRIRLVDTIISESAACMAPVAMILTGFVIAGYEIKSLLKVKQTYIVAVLRLIVFPTIFVLALRFLNTDSEIIFATLCANAMPLGMNTVIIPSAYGESPQTGASLALVSQAMAAVTVPTMFLIFF